LKKLRALYAGDGGKTLELVVLATAAHDNDALAQICGADPKARNLALSYLVAVRATKEKRNALAIKAA
jgi:hypothetical protein